MDRQVNNKKPQGNQANINKKNLGTFTHFISVPLNDPVIKKKILDLQSSIMQEMSEQQRSVVSPTNPNIFHVTLSMLTLPKQYLKEKAQNSLLALRPSVKALNNDSVDIELKKLGFFKKAHRQHPGKDEYDELSLIYLDITPNEFYERLELTCHTIIKEFIAQEVIHEDDLKSMNIAFKNSKYKPEKMHITLFRVREQSYKDDSGNFIKYNWRNVFEKYGDIDIGQVSIPHIDISTRFEYDEDKFYKPLLRLTLTDENDFDKKSGIIKEEIKVD